MRYIGFIKKFTHLGKAQPSVKGEGLNLGMQVDFRGFNARCPVL